ncbi:hypothetical protein FQN50_003852 [Emmonsiellopsis sp. PD_5]|nr:hypothetical protein FQN50_003852 [Emmonsiellopsis sp. PD_5]
MSESTTDNTLSQAPTTSTASSTSPSSTIYHIYFTSPAHFHFTLSKSPSKRQPLYYVHNSYFTPGKSDMIMHAGPSSAAPIIAQCKFVLFSTGTKIGLGNPAHNNGNDMIWEDLTRESKDHSRYRYELDLDMQVGLDLPDTNTDTTAGNHDFQTRRNMNHTGRRRAFQWKRTHSFGVDDSKPSKLSPSNYKLVDEETGEIVAVFANNGFKSFRKKGKLEIFNCALEGRGKGFEIMVVMGGLALMERERRRSMQWRYDHY